MTKPDFQYDLKSSIVVFLVALPLCLGIALASGAPLASGLIAGIIGGVVIGGMSGSHISVSGPAAGLTVIVFNGITQLGGFEAFGWAVLIAGILQLIFGFVKGGVIGDYFPSAVIRGMLAAIGIILIMKQLPNALGLPKGSWALSEMNKGVALISVISLAIMIGWDKLAATGRNFFKLVPGPLVAVIVTVIANQVFHMVNPEGLVKLPNSMFTGLNFPELSALDFSVFQVGMTIAVVASLETLLCMDAGDKMDPMKRKTDKNRELLAQGVGNALSGILGGLPLTAVIVRTSANVTAGAKTKYSAIFHGAWILLCVLLIPGTLNLIPLATLACVLLLVGYKLTKPSFYVEMHKRGWEQLFIFCVTILAIVGTDLLKGIFAGLAVAIAFELRRPAISCLEVIKEEDKVHIKFVRNVSFLHKAKIGHLLNDIEEGKSVYFHGMKLHRIHVDVHELIGDFHQECQKTERKVFYL